LDEDGDGRRIDAKPLFVHSEELFMNDHDKSVRTLRIARRTQSAKVNVEVGTGAIAPKIAIARRKNQKPVKVEFGTGAIAPKVALHRGKAL
jgi:hypothetical protein